MGREEEEVGVRRSEGRGKHDERRREGGSGGVGMERGGEGEGGGSGVGTKRGGRRREVGSACLAQPASLFLI
jgi:hypothetical protein